MPNLEIFNLDLSYNDLEKIHIDWKMFNNLNNLQNFNL